MYINIESTHNGYIVEIQTNALNKKRYVFKSIEILQMLEFVGTTLNDKKVEVRER